MPRVIHSIEGVIVWTVAQKGMKISCFFLPNSELTRVIKSVMLMHIHVQFVMADGPFKL